MRCLKIFGTAAIVMGLWGLSTFKATAIQMPSGSYRETCRNIRMVGDELSAQCKNSRGEWPDARLRDANRCQGSVANEDGQLVCHKDNSLPPGSYTKTCKSISRNLDGLTALCRNRAGRWIKTYLDHFSECRGGIVNDDGTLRCGAGGEVRRLQAGGAAPRGSYSQTCRDISVRGDQLTARCQDIRGAWRETTLSDFPGCVGDIVNDDGALECTRPGGRSVPRGSYVETCREIYVRGDTLRARCKDREGRWLWTQLNDWDNCRSGIVNADGHLECRR